jgi:hypothetical protein
MAEKKISAPDFPFSSKLKVYAEQIKRIRAKFTVSRRMKVTEFLSTLKCDVYFVNM